jgi:predicted kinase
MRILLLLRGAPGCGKSTWIEKNGLKMYALSADDIRLLCQSPVLQPDGTESISQNQDKLVWKTLFTLLETRMQRGEFTVIDATNSRTSEMSRYKELCETYRYRMYCADFTDLPVEEVKRRNAGRVVYKRVPEEVIDRMYARFATQKIPSGIKVIRPEELEKIWLKQIDLSGYRRIHHIGDIHGCNTALQKYLAEQGGIRDDEFYIFTGDYIDRGIENAQVLNFLISIMDRKNVLMLEGNHEKWLWMWSNGNTAKSKEFELVTKPALEAAGVSQKQVRKLYRKLGQCAYYRYGNDVYLVTHAGLSTLPENLSLVATDLMIRGVGSYNDFETIAETFLRTTPDNHYQIHGHRNTKRLPIQVNDRVFNLEGRVEFGGDLRCVQVDADGIHTMEVKNEVFQAPEIQPENRQESLSVPDTIAALRSNPYIQEKTFGNISSFNFTREAFHEQIWDEQTTRARGLYIDTVRGKVAARSYDKFFNINECWETRFENLQKSLQFPVTAYVKENGFLGIVGYDETEDDLFIASKSSKEGPFAGWLREMVERTISQETRNRMKEYIRSNQVSFVFECVDMQHDPHVIEYPESQLFLLDIIYNRLDFAKYEYDRMVDVAYQFGLTTKEKALELTDWQEFYDWYFEVTAQDYEYEGRKIEGYVIEDSKGYMVKLKLAYYKFWKFMRAVSHEAIKNGRIRKTSVLTTPTAIEFYDWVRTLHDREDCESIRKDICSLRQMFYQERVNAAAQNS